jgi:hypothetical protein
MSKPVVEINNVAFAITFHRKVFWATVDKNRAVLVLGLELGERSDRIAA